MTTAPARRSRAPVIVGLAAIALAAVAVVVWLVAFHETPAVSVYPGKRVVAALPGTTIVVRGAAADDLGDLTVTGSVSGPHSGRWRPHPDGDGAAFVPDEPFAPEERVSVDAGRPIAGADGEETSFVIAPASNAPPPPFDAAPVPGGQGDPQLRVAPGPAPAGGRRRHRDARRRHGPGLRRAQARGQRAGTADPRRAGAAGLVPPAVRRRPGLRLPPPDARRQAGADLVAGPGRAVPRLRHRPDRRHPLPPGGDRPDGQRLPDGRARVRAHLARHRAAIAYERGAVGPVEAAGAATASSRTTSSRRSTSDRARSCSSGTAWARSARRVDRTAPTKRGQLGTTRATSTR